jgi:dihydropyrimidine dehydrogenase (NAD+) subunit PreA
VSDFADIFLPYTDGQAKWEASRCLGCHDAPCNYGCNAGVDVRRFIRQINHDDVIGAAETIRRANVFGGACARMCDAASKCMKRCLRSRIDDPIDIPGLQWYAIEAERRAGARPLPVGPDRGRAVAVVGAGPAGLSAAAELRRLGHRVELFDLAAKTGGILTNAIPHHRLPPDLVEAEIDAILKTGVTFHPNTKIEIIDELLRSFDAVIVATGLGLLSRLGVDGEDLDGVFPAAWLLDGSVKEVGSRPVVVGGGVAAMDAAAVALRLAGPEGRVAVLYRRGEQQMPAYPMQRRLAFEEGVILRPLTVVERILGDRERKVAAVRCRAVDLGREDTSGRPAPVELSGGTFDLQATSVIVAAGEIPDPNVLECFGLSEAEPRCDEKGRTDREKIYVAGDVIGGMRGAAWAVRSGKTAAQTADFDLRSGSELDRVFPVLGPSVDLSFEFLGKVLPNPFLLAASPCTDNLEMARAGLRAGWAGLVLKTTSVGETKVNLKYPMMAARSEGGRMMTALGNIDLISEHAVDEVCLRISQLKEEFPDRWLAASIMGENRTQWQRLARQLAASGVDAIECSFSCPQGSLGSHPGAMLGQDSTLVRTVTRWVKDAAGEVPVVIKITPQVSDLAEIARAVAEGGGDAICAASSIPGLVGMDVERSLPLPAVGGRTSFSGISGPAILPLALRAVNETARATAIPIIGNGGAESWHDAVAMMQVGASAVQFCTAVMHHGFDLIDTLCGGLGRYMERQGIEKVQDISRLALDNITTHPELVQPGPVRARVDAETCVNCGRCFIACRDGAFGAVAWDQETRKPTIDLTRCTGCGLCVGLCPSASISLLTLK